MTSSIGRLGLIAVFLGAQSSSAATTLEPGTALNLELSADQAQSIRFAVPENSPFLIEASQDEIGVILTARSIDRVEEFTVNNPVQDHGVESMLLEAAGRYVIEIRADAGGSGRTTIRASLLSSDAAGGTARIAAERAMTQAAAASYVDTLESRRLAATEYKTALKMWRQIADASQEARTLYFLGMLDMAMNEPSHARARFEGATAIFESIGDTAMQANVIAETGACYMLTADYAAARTEFLQALKLHEQIGNRVNAAFDLSNIGLSHHYAGALDEALHWYERALATLEGQNAPRQLAMVKNNIGGVHLERGDADLAIQYFEQAVALAQADGDLSNAAVGLGNLGYQYRRVGEMNAALDRFQSALVLFRKLEDHREEAWALAGVANVYNAIGEPERALAVFEDVLDLRVQTEDIRGAAAVHAAMGDLYLQRGAISVAREHLCRALATYIGAEPSAHICAGGTAATSDTLSLDAVEVLIHVARLELLEKDPARALQILDPTISAATGAGLRRALGRATRVKAEALHATGNTAAARSAYHQALLLLRDTGDIVSAAETLQAMAHLERDAGQDEAALTYSAEAIDAIETGRRRVGSAELRAAFLGSRIDAYDLQIELLMQKQFAAPRAGYAGKAFAVSERARARSLLDVLDSIGVVASGAAEGALADERRLLQRRVRGKARQQQNVLGREHTADEAKAAESELQQALTELDLVDARIGMDAVGKLQSVTLDTDAIQRQLDPDTALLEYALGETQSYVWLVSSTGLHSYQLPPRAEIDAQARAAYVALSSPVPNDPGDKAVAWLAEHLLPPAADIGDVKRLVIVPDGALHYVPFSALPLPGSEVAGGPSENVVLGHYETIVLPSASVLPDLRRPRSVEPRSDRLLALVADPVFSLGDERVTGNRRSQDVTKKQRHQPLFVPLAEAATLDRLQRLPGTRAEARAISALVPDGTARLWLGLDARADAVIGGALGEYQFVHFATHGFFNDEHPSLSGLVLTQFDGAGRELDGFLGLNEIYGLRFDADLVVLSGCETGLGQMLQGEGLIGLTRGFMYAGVPRVVASLWKVPDGSTSRLMAAFYRAMFDDGLAPAAALRQAQLALRSEARFSQPFHWAGFMLEGEWR